MLGCFGHAGICKLLVHRRVRDRSERQRLGLLSYDPANGGLITEWIAGDELPVRRSGSPGWRPHALDRCHPLGQAGAAGTFRVLVQSRSLRDPHRSCVGVLSHGHLDAGLVTERIMQDAFPPSLASRP